VAQDNYYRLTGEREKLRATQTLASERAKLLAEELEEAKISGRDPGALEAEAETLSQEEQTLRAQVAAADGELASIASSVREAESAFAAEEKRIAAALRALADAREGSARREGHLRAIESKIAQAEEERGRLVATMTEVESRIEKSSLEYATKESALSGLGAGETDLDSEYEKTKRELDDALARQGATAKKLVELERDLSSAISKRDALQQAAIHRDGAGAILAKPEGFRIKGTLASLIEIERGWEIAVANVLGTLADAIVVEDLSGAIDALTFLGREEKGRADVIILGAASEAIEKVPTSLTSLLSKAKSKTLEGLLPKFLGGVVVADSLDEAKRIITDHPDLIAVTEKGELLSRTLARGGSGNSLVQINHLIETTSELVEHLTHDRDRLRFESSGHDDEVAKVRALHEAALARLNESDSKMAAIAEEMAAIGQSIASARDEKSRLEVQSASLEASLKSLGDDLARAQTEMSSDHVVTEEPDSSALEGLRAELARVRGLEVDARLALRTAEERATALAQRITELRESAQRERESASRQIARREARGRGALVAQEIAETAYEALIQIEVSISRAAAERERLEISRSDREGETLAIRAKIRELGSDLEELTSSVHQDEMARAEQRLRIEQLEAKALEEFGIEREILVAEYGPENPVSTFSENELGEVIAGEPMPFKREAQQRRLAQAERSLALLGRINPLALEEYSALEERLKYLADQMEDLKKSRKDLMDIIKEVDDKVLEIFRTAYQDTAKEFEGIFARLFPGGEGRLILTNPDDMLTTGIDVEARPPGKRIKRLSLLSGGERSLTAVALLIAIFKARPSPFYVMDEVEAALDDINLGRLLGILEELRSSSQLIVITHQKRTMEIADALYGVTMRGDGVSEVISQRLREAVSS